MDNALRGKCIVVGVTGSIAACKAADIVSRLRQAGAEVHVVMTAAATHFAAPLTFSTLSGNQVVVDMFAAPQHWEVYHVSLADRADAVLIAPATANIIGKLAAGIADDILTCIALATRAPLIVAPAMNVHMLEHRQVQANIAHLRGLGYRVLECDEGRLACGYEGKGRLPDPAAIVAEVERVLSAARDLEGLSVLITSGPTREPIDAVRFISNPSTGKMGYALAEAAARRGAEVTVVTGPTTLPDPSGIQVVHVQTTKEMLAAVEERVEGADVVIGAAAPSDYAPQNPVKDKIRKSAPQITLDLERTPDVLAQVSQTTQDCILVGFTAETASLITRAKQKLKQKRLDLIVANDVTAEGAGFAVDTNIATLVFPDGQVEQLPLMSKLELAHRVMDVVAQLAAARRGG
ncbi:MAG: bifunctional phosphopantothenoylcysteine decarboxylase/phosphopantothenate--cysteine ligase CoaBC [Armatimonadota bacterium]|nr:MAG: bifunctional phosphopantothenoylcysteine decarboxylase/phosphopantothenate--cysteine ligase CoaBC [Armatimonadota bacterium]